MEQKLTITKSDPNKLTKKDFESDQDVRWCPGCGDYAILAGIQKVLPELGIPKEKYAFISGIGCSSRLPYYMDTYGFHTIHGRAPTIATGLKIMQPDLSVWVITGDGDGFSIGTNHLVHLMRRNLDITVLLFNNKIYGLTKGQYSPTSEEGKITKSSPFGAPDKPLSPVHIALAANCSFVARAIDVDATRLQAVLKAAALHKGTSFVEIYQNCNVFNDGAFSNTSDRGVRDENTYTLEPGKPIIFGKGNDKTIIIEQDKVIVKSLSEQQATIYNPELQPSLPSVLSNNSLDLPVAIGIFRQENRDTYEDVLNNKISKAKENNTDDLEKVLSSGSTWYRD